MLSFLRLSFIPASADLGLLVLRLVSGGAMLWLHGKPKLMDFEAMSAKFPTIIANAKVSLGLAVFAEVLCAALLILGLFTRFAALALAITMGVAFFMAHKAALTGPGNGEMAMLYMATYVTIFFAGAGKFSLDGSGSK